MKIVKRILVIAGVVVLIVIMVVPNFIKAPQQPALTPTPQHEMTPTPVPLAPLPTRR